MESFFYTTAIIAIATSLALAMMKKHYFLFRFYFGFWPKQTGAERMIAPRLKIVKDIYKIRKERAETAKDKYDRAYGSPQQIKTALNGLRAANGECDAVSSKYFRMRDVAECFGYKEEVKEVGRSPY